MRRRARAHATRAVDRDRPASSSRVGSLGLRGWSHPLDPRHALSCCILMLGSPVRTRTRGTGSPCQAPGGAMTATAHLISALFFPQLLLPGSYPTGVEGKEAPVAVDLFFFPNISVRHIDDL